MTSRRALVPLLVVATAAAALWHFRIVMPIRLPQAVGSRNGDLYTIYYPLYSFFYQGGEFMPWWNPYQMAGTPTVGYMAGGLYYPPHLLYAVLPVHEAMGLLAVLHLAVAGAGTLLLARSLGLSAAASLFAAFAFLSNRALVGEHFRMQYLEGLSWIPFAALALGSLLESPGVKSVVGLALVVALQVLTGDVQIVCYEAYVGLLVALGYALGSRCDVRHMGKVVAAASAAGVLAAALAAVQVVPTLAVVAEAVRGYGGLTLEQTLPPPQTWAFFLRAFLLSGVAILLAPFSVLVPRSQRRSVILLWIVTAVVVAIGCGTVVYRAVFYRLPGVDLFRLPHQILLVSSLALCLLAGFGLDALRSNRRYGLGAVLLAFAVAFGASTAWIGRGWVVAMGVAIAVVMLASLRGRAVGWAVGLLVATLAGERFVGTSNAIMIPAANDAAFFRAPPVVEFLRRTVGFDRVLVIKNWRDRFPLMEKLGTLSGFSVVQDYEPLTPRSYQQLLRDLEERNPDRPLFWGRYVAPPAEDGWRALDVLSARYVVADRKMGWVPPLSSRFRPVYGDADAVVYENLKSLPRVQVVEDYRVVSDEQQALDLLLHGDFDPRREVILDRDPSGALPGPTADVAASVKVTSRTPSTVEVAASTPRRAILLLNDLHWPGWEATLDGEPTPVYRANVLFRAVALPPGTHEIVFSYADGRLRLGLLTSLTALLSCVGLVAFTGIRRGRLRDPGGPS
jgi:hypothetical protein